MTQNILIAGVGGQGILSISYVLCHAALEEGLHIKQSEVHGMAQRGGAVQSQLRLSPEPIASDLIPKGACNLILSMEPLEGLRYLPYLHPDGIFLTSINAHVNIGNYPDLTLLEREFENLSHAYKIDAKALAKEAGSVLSQSMVMLGAASSFLTLDTKHLEGWTADLWQRKGERVVETNLKAFRLGRQQTSASRGSRSLVSLRTSMQPPAL